MMSLNNVNEGVKFSYFKIIIKLFLMSFFTQTQRKTNIEKVGSPSPCQYNLSSLSNSRNYACAPFGSTQKLDRSMNKQKSVNPEKKQKQDEQIFYANNLNINIKPQQQSSSMFKSQTQRFREQIQQQKPGPGQYQLANKHLHSRSHAAFTHNFPLNIKPTVPSIPVDNLGFKEDENNQMKKVQAPKTQPPHAGSYELRTNLSGKGVLVWKAQKIVNRQSQQKPGPGQYNYQQLQSNKSLSSCFTSTTNRFGLIKKIKQDKIPGPGAYNVKPLKTLSHNISSQVFFNSRTSRFDKNTVDSSIGPGAYFNDKKKSHSVNQIKKIDNREEEVVNRIPKRNTIFQSHNKNPGPGQYKTNFGISYQLHKSLLKKQTTDVFPKQKRTVFQKKAQQYLPGPGAYEAPPKRVSKQPQGKLWKKTQVVNLKQQPQNNPSPLEYANFYNTIEAKIKQMNSKLTLSDEKPFNSGAQRFKHYSNKKYDPQAQIQSQQQMTEETEIDLASGADNKKVKRLVMTTIKVKVPFGVSSNKYEQKQPDYYGPDFYNKDKGWTKPSFNIKGKLQ